jgi:hypothetical protein
MTYSVQQQEDLAVARSCAAPAKAAGMVYPLPSLYHITSLAPLFQLKLASKYKSCPPRLSSLAKACITVQSRPPRLSSLAKACITLQSCLPASFLQLKLASQYNHAPLTPLLQLKLASQFNHAPLFSLFQQSWARRLPGAVL